ncbi:MAG: type II secretion system protein [Gemmatimonadales bacterium]
MNHGERGMTLLELVVGLTIAGVAVSAGYGALASITDQSERAARAADGATAAAGKRRLLLRWIEGARLDVERAGPTFRGLDGVHDSPDDELTFLTTAPTEASSGRTVVRLYVDRDTLTPERGLTAELSNWPRPERTRIEIDRAVGGLDCRYFTRMLGAAEWLPSWISGTVLPLAVEIRLLPAPGDSLPPLLRLPLLVPLEPAQ